MDSPINLHLTSEKTRRKKIGKKNLKKKFSKKNLSATFHIFSKCHFLNFLSHWGGCLAPMPQVDTPINLHLTILNYQENKKKKFKKKNQKKKFRKKSEKNLSRKKKF